MGFLESPGKVPDFFVSKRVGTLSIYTTARIVKLLPPPITLVFPHYMYRYEILAGRGPVTRVSLKNSSIYGLKMLNCGSAQSKQPLVVIIA